MPKNTRRTVTKSAASNKAGKGRKKQRAAHRTTTLTPKQREAPSKEAAPSRQQPHTQQVVPHRNILPDLKRIGIIAGAMLILLIILYLVL